MGILFFASVLGYAIGIRWFFSRIRMGAALLSAVCSMILFSYVLVILCGFYRLGAYFVIYLGYLSGIIGISLFIRKAKSTEALLKHSYLKKLISEDTLPVLIFCAIAFMGAFSIRGMEAFPSHDNYSFWARAVREMWIFDTTYFNGDSNIRHADYCSAIASLQYSVVRVFGWKNEYLCYVLLAIVAASFSSIYDRFGWKQIGYVSFSIISCLALYPIADQSIDFDELLMDGPIAMMVAAAILLWVAREDNSISSIFPIVLVSFVLVTAKLYTGLIFAVVLFVFILIYWIRNKQIMNAASVVMIAAAILFAYFSWSAYYNYSSEIQAYEVKLEESQYLGIQKEVEERPKFLLSHVVRGNPRNDTFAENLEWNTVQQNWETAKPFVMELFSKKLVGATHSCITVFSILTVNLFFLAAIFFFLPGVWKSQMKYCCFIAVVSAFVYSMGMLITFLIVQPEASSSAIRYFSTVLIIFQNILFHYLSRLFSERKKPAFWIAGVLVTGLLMFISPAYLYDSYVVEHNYFCVEAAQSGIEAAKEWVEDGDRVLYIDNRDKKVGEYGLRYCYRYYSLPNHSTALGHTYGMRDDLAQTDPDWLESRLKNNRTNKLVIMTDDFAYREKYANILGIDVSVAQPWVFGVRVENGVFSYELLNCQQG